MTTHTLPHDSYIEAVAEALDAAGIPVKDGRTSDAETVGVHPHLTALIEIDLDDTEYADYHPHGIVVLWDHYTGRDRPTQRRTRWEWAPKEEDGSNGQPILLPVEGYASPAAVATGVRQALEGDFDTEVDEWWDQHIKLQDAIRKWVNS